MSAKVLLARLRKDYRSRTIEEHRMNIRRLLLAGSHQQPMQIESRSPAKQITVSSERNSLSKIIFDCEMVQTKYHTCSLTVGLARNDTHETEQIRILKKLLSYWITVTDKQMSQEQQLWSETSNSSDHNVQQETTKPKIKLCDFEVVADLFEQLSLSHPKRRERLDCLDVLAGAFHAFILQFGSQVLCQQTQTVIRIWSKVESIFPALLTRLREGHSLTMREVACTITFITNKITFLKACSLMGSQQVVNINKKYINLILEMDNFDQPSIERLILKAVCQLVVKAHLQQSECFSLLQIWFFLVKHAQEWSKSEFSSVWIQDCCCLLQISMLCLPAICEANFVHHSENCSQLPQVLSFVSTLTTLAIRTYYTKRIEIYPILRKKFIFLLLSLMLKFPAIQLMTSRASFCRTVVEDSQGDSDLQLLGVLMFCEIYKYDLEQKGKLLMYYEVNLASREIPRLLSNRVE